MSSPTVSPSTASQATASPAGERTLTATSSANGQVSSRLPRSAPRSFFKRRLGLLIIVALVGGAAALGFFLTMGRAQTYDGPVAAVQKKRLQVTIVERGTLESAENSEIICRVKAASKGSSVSTHIKWVIADGKEVEPGDKLIELDDSALQDQRREQLNKVAEAKAAWIQKDENYKIALSQSILDIEKARTAKIIAEIDLRKYMGERAANRVAAIEDRAKLVAYLRDGLERDMEAERKRDGDDAGHAVGGFVSEYVQTLSDIEGRLEIARSDLAMWEDRAAWSARMVGKDLMSRSQADSDKFRRDSAKVNLRKVDTELAILKKYTLERTVTDLWSKVLEADRALSITQSQARSRENTAKAELESKLSVYDQEKQKLKEIEDEIAKCVIYAPHEGLVVYFVPESSRFGSSSSQQALIQEGEPVREGQKLMRIPNLNRMLVDTRVHEAMVSKVKGETYENTGFTEAVRAGMLAAQPELASIDAAFTGIGAIFCYNLEARDDFREYESKKIYSGHPATIRVEAFASTTYKGKVKSKATVASQNDFVSSEVKVYKTMVAIDGLVKDLKPGMSAEVTILADQTEDEVLVVPIQAVVGSLTMGAKRKCFVIDERGRSSERDIEVGLSNDKEVEIKRGLQEGDKVALNPRALLGEKSDLKPATPGKQRGPSGDDGGKKGGKKGGGEGKGGGEPKGKGKGPAASLPTPRVDLAAACDRHPRMVRLDAVRQS